MIGGLPHSELNPFQGCHRYYFFIINNIPFINISLTSHRNNEAPCLALGSVTGVHITKPNDSTSYTQSQQYRQDPIRTTCKQSIVLGRSRNALRFPLGWRLFPGIDSYLQDPGQIPPAQKKPKPPGLKFRPRALIVSQVLHGIMGMSFITHIVSRVFIPTVYKLLTTGTIPPPSHRTRGLAAIRQHVRQEPPLQIA